MASLVFEYGAMNAGKSTSLLQTAYGFRQKGMVVSLWTSQHYVNDGDLISGQISSRIGLQSSALTFDPETDMFAEIEKRLEDQPISAVFCDEAQFLVTAQAWQLARIVDELNIPVYCFGLRTDFKGELFEGSAALLALADNIREARAVCFCGAKASMNLRKSAAGKVETSGKQVAVEKSVYVSVCRKHWVAEQTDLDC